MKSLLLKAALKLLEAVNKRAEEMLGREIVNVIKYHSIGVAIASLLSNIFFKIEEAKIFPDNEYLVWVAIICFLIGIFCLWAMYFRIKAKVGFSFFQHFFKSVFIACGTNIVACFLAIAVIPIVDRYITPLLILCVDEDILKEHNDVITPALTVLIVTLFSGLVYLKVLTFCALRKNKIANASNVAVEQNSEDTQENKQ